MSPPGGSYMMCEASLGYTEKLLTFFKLSTESVSVKVIIKKESEYLVDKSGRIW